MDTQLKKPKKPIETDKSDDAWLTPKLRAELKRRIDDANDPTRYVIVSAFSQRFCLYHMPEDGNYTMNEIPDRALFKRRAEAQAVAKVLDRSRKRRSGKSLQVVAVRKTKKGVQFLELVTSPWNKRQGWKPKLRRRKGKP